MNDKGTHSMNRSIVSMGIVFVLLLLVLINIKPVLFGGAKVVTLKSAPPLTSQISQAFTSSANTGPLPVSGKDYTLTDTKYFDNRQWVVTSIKPLNQTITEGMAILQLQHGIYTVVLGPGTAFASTDVQTMPADLVQYLNQVGIIYDPVYDE